MSAQERKGIFEFNHLVRPARQETIIQRTQLEVIRLLSIVHAHMGVSRYQDIFVFLYRNIIPSFPFSVNLTGITPRLPNGRAITLMSTTQTTTASSYSTPAPP